MGQKNKRSIGTSGEEAASDYLSKVGYEIIARNYRVGRLGEIDIIARENEYICFIEVKTRKNYLFGTPSESVNWRKRESIKKLAWVFIKQNNLNGSNMRFDIVEVIGSYENDRIKAETINLMRNAF